MFFPPNRPVIPSYKIGLISVINAIVHPAGKNEQLYFPHFLLLLYFLILLMTKSFPFCFQITCLIFWALLSLFTAIALFSRSASSPSWTTVIALSVPSSVYGSWWFASVQLLVFRGLGLLGNLILL